MSHLTLTDATFLLGTASGTLGAMARALVMLETEYRKSRSQGPLRPGSWTDALGPAILLPSMALQGAIGGAVAAAALYPANLHIGPYSFACFVGGYSVRKLAKAFALGKHQAR